jgi:Neutral/alkaline non-lysosomal ceramidase, N-terminal
MRNNIFSTFLALFIALLIVSASPFIGCGDDDDDDDSADTDSDDDTDDGEDDDDTGDDGEPHFQVGASRIDVSPPPDWSLKMGGYGTYFLLESMCRWSTGVHDPLYATAIAFDDGKGEPIILIQFDMVGVITTDIVQIQEGIAQQLNIGPERIVVSSSHTHHSPDGIGIWGLILPAVSGRDEDYMVTLIEGGIEAGVEAYEARVPAVVSFATGIEEDMHYNSNDVLDRQAITDDAMTLMSAKTPGGESIATLMSWGCHPMVMGPQNTELSADFLGPYYRLMDEEVGGINMFVNGNLGASVHPINPFDPFDYSGRDWGTWEDVERFGRVLVDDAKVLIDDAETATNTNLWLRSIKFESTNDNLFFALVGILDLIPRDIPPMGETANTTVTVFSIGPVQFGTIPGELVPDIGLILRDVMGAEHQFVINLGMDWLGYILLPRQYHHIAYIYNVLLSPGPDAGTDLIDAYLYLYGYQ